MIQQLNLNPKAKIAADFFSLKQPNLTQEKSTCMAREKEKLVSIEEFNKLYVMKLTIRKII